MKLLLDEGVDRYNRVDFIAPDPVSIPHRYSLKEDIEISGFLVATIAWGQRPVILKNGVKLMELMDDAPYNFIAGAGPRDFKRLSKFVHRTFNGDDLTFFAKCLQRVYKHSGGLEFLFTESLQRTGNDMGLSINRVRNAFFGDIDPARCGKHFADPLRHSSAKRLNMFLRWMVRRDRRGVDFGLWRGISPSVLHCPLDVHSGRVARELGLLQRTQNDWQAVTELTAALRQFDAKDPVKYDYFLFGAGVEGFCG